MTRLVYILNGVAMFLIFGFALCADSLMDVYGPLGFLLRGGVCIGIAGICISIANHLEWRQTKNRPRYYSYRGRRGKRKR